jgi:hypothetical protein
MRSAVAVAAVFVVLDLAALDDITTGSQLTFWPEYLMLASSVVPFTVVGALWQRRRRAAG